MDQNNLELHRRNAQTSPALASALFPGEEWIAHREGIFVAKTRLAGSHKEQAKLYREIADVRILTTRGSIVYFLPEHPEGPEIGKKYADTVIDGAVVELKTISGNRTTLGKSFKKGYKQGLSVLEAHPGIQAEHDVFLRLYTPFTVESVRAKIAGEMSLRGASPAVSLAAPYFNGGSFDRKFIIPSGLIPNFCTLRVI